MEADHLSRLKEEQEKAIQTTKEKILTWDKFKSDYKALQDRLLTLPNEFSHGVMVPFGPLAFMPGRLVHTNEVLVLLGDNWFVDRSAKQAHDIVSRRIEVIEENISRLNEQMQLLTPRADFTQEFQEEGRGAMRDISETITEEEAEEWKAQHSKHVREFHQKQQAEKESVKKSLTNNEMWERLDELEKSESEGKEIDRLPEVEATPWPVVPSDLDGRAHVADRGDESLSSDDDEWETDSDTSDSREDPQPDRSRLIHVRHTKLEEAAIKSSETEDENLDASGFHITSPADIYKYFGETSKLKTILKSDFKTKPQKGKQISSVSFDMPEPVFQDVIKETENARPQVKAFLDEVVESHSSESNVPEADNNGEQIQPKRMSKFKSQRQRQQFDNR